MEQALERAASWQVIETVDLTTGEIRRVAELDVWEREQTWHDPKVTDLDYINFLVTAPRVVSCTEAARVQSDGPRRAAHDALTRLLQRLEPDPAPLWCEAEQH